MDTSADVANAGLTDTKNMLIIIAIADFVRIGTLFQLNMGITRKNADNRVNTNAKLSNLSIMKSIGVSFRCIGCKKRVHGKSR